MDKLSESATTPRNNDPTPNFSNTAMPAQTPPQHGVQNTPTPNKWTVHVCPTTGGQFDIQVSAEDSIDNIKKCISKRLKISKERISLLHKERLLKEGTLTENGVSEGGKITLLPNVESGLMSQRQENSVMQALENLSEPQVNDFLAGKSPLTLAMRLGDHMMFVQLQLSTSQSSSKRTTSSSSSSRHRSAKHAGGVSSSSASSTSSQSRHQANAPHLQQQQKQQTVPSYVSPPQVSPSNSISSPSPLGTGSKVVVPVPVHAQPRSTSHPYAACHPNNSNLLPAAAGAAPQIASGLNAPKPATGVTAPKPTKVDGAPVLDSTALAEASRNLSQKLKELSAVSSTHIKTPIDVKQKKKVKKTHINEPVRGAIIESMQHHGQGVYSGTFSGTLNPALQDRNGKPKKSVSTIIHILNDLLGASPQYRAQMIHQQRHHGRHAERMARASHRTAARASDQLRRRENRATRGKMEQLQMMMRERHERRKARREARASPYMPSWSSNASQIAQMSTTHNTPTRSGDSSAMEVDANVETSNVSDNMSENNGYTQLKTETVVA